MEHYRISSGLKKNVTSGFDRLSANFVKERPITPHFRNNPRKNKLLEFEFICAKHTETTPVFFIGSKKPL